jgi:hypothetical protein
MKYRLVAAVVLLLCTTGCMSLENTGVYVMRWEPASHRPVFSNATFTIWKERSWLKRWISGEDWVMGVDGPPGSTPYMLKGRVRWGDFNGSCELQTRTGLAVMKLSGRVNSPTTAAGDFELRVGDERAEGVWAISPDWNINSP